MAKLWRKHKPRSLGRREPTDFEHIARYPLAALPEGAVGQPVVLGINWYEAFDRPEWFANGWWIGRNPNLGALRGGHCICAPPEGLSDLGTWHAYYDQKSEGACVGYAVSRMQTLRNRRAYNALPVYKHAQEVDEWPGTDYEGTSVRAGLEVLRTEGAPYKGTVTFKPGAGISAYRWITSVEELSAVLASPRNDASESVRLLNSWGLAYPHYVRMPYTIVNRLLHEYGEIAVATDR